MLRINVLILCCLAGCCLGDSVVLNEAVDLLLAQVNSHVEDVITTPDISGSSTKRKGFIKITTSLDCDHGAVGHLRTLRRTGDVVLSSEPDKVTLKVELGLGELYAHFDKCRVKVSHLFSASHELECTVDSNSVSAQISVFFPAQGPCTAHVDEVAMTSMGNIHVHIGGSVFEKVLNKVVDLLTRAFKKDITHVVTKHLNDAANKAVSELNSWCANIPH